ncbi:MAG: hypothetical protein LUD02_06045 [Tannerellaceae bacterium]|nr:hypothetical protein [Tannerellaceae bacterium]
MKKRGSIILLGIIYSLVICAQDTKIPPVQINVIKKYFEETSLYSPIYSGKEHMAYPHFYQGYSFLESPDYHEGSLVYDGVYYPSLHMKLDLYTNQIVVQTPDKLSNVIINNDQVNHLYLHSYYIFYHLTDRMQGSPPTGFYLRLFEGSDFTILERRTALLDTRIEGKELQYKFFFRSRFYICKEDIYYPVRTLAGALNLFKPYEKELKQFAKKNKLNLIKLLRELS